MSARKSAPRVSPPGTAFSPGKALIGMKVARKFIEKRRHGFIRGVVVDHRDKDALWGETFDVTTDDDGGLDAGMTPEELLFILERDDDKQKAIAQESWALARSLLSARDPWRDVTTYQPPFMQDVKWLHGFQELVHEDGTDCYEAKIDDAKGRAHHFAFHFPTRWGAAAAHDVLARRLEYYGPGVKKGTRRNYASDVSWDVLVGILVAGAAWVPPGNGGGTKGVKVKAAVEEEESESEEEEEEEEEEEGEESSEEEEEEEKRPTKKVNYDERRTSFSAWTAAELAALEAGVKAHGVGEYPPMFKQVPTEKNFHPDRPTHPSAGNSLRGIWVKILKDPKFAKSLKNRTNKALSDKWRTFKTMETGKTHAEAKTPAKRQTENAWGHHEAVRQSPTMSARKVAPVAPRLPHQPADSPCMRLVGIHVTRESIWEGYDDPTTGTVKRFHINQVSLFLYLVIFGYFGYFGYFWLFPYGQLY